MRKILLQKIKILFECKIHNKSASCDPVDLITSGVPMCEKCDDEMEMASEYAHIDI